MPTTDTAENERLRQMVVEFQKLVEREPGLADRIALQVDRLGEDDHSHGEAVQRDHLADFKYWAFISYSHKDAKWGDWLHRELEQYRVPWRLVGKESGCGVVPRRIFPIFRDREELSAASELSSEIQSALKSSRFLIVICSVESAKSQWVHEEIKFFKQLNGSRQVLCVIVDGEPNAWDGSQECFPEPIKFEVSSTGQLTGRTCEPIAADARRQGDGKSNARLKVLSGVLGVKYDALRRREQIRFRQRIAIWSTVAAAASLIFASYFISLRQEYQRRQNVRHATDLVTALLKADIDEVPSIVEQIEPIRAWADPKLVDTYEQTGVSNSQKLRAAVALLPVDQSKLDFVSEQLLSLPATQFSTVRDTMLPHKDELVGRYWRIATDTGNPERVRFHAACALASFDSENANWESDHFSHFVANHLVNVLPSELKPWRNALTPVRDSLTVPLKAIFRDERAGEQERSFAADTLADYYSDDANQLFDLLVETNESQFKAIFGALGRHRLAAISRGIEEVSMPLPVDADDADKERIAIRKANAATMLLRLGSGEHVWPLLKHSNDPRVRSYIIHWLGPRGCDIEPLIVRLDQEEDVTIRRALILCLGEFEVPDSEKPRIAKRLLRIYQSDPDAGLHAAAGWLLRKWNLHTQHNEINALLLESAKDRLPKDAPSHWYVAANGSTMVVVNGGQLRMRRLHFGQPTEETQEVSVEGFEISATEITRDQYARFLQDADPLGIPRIPQDPATHRDAPQGIIRWNYACAYCNWLSARAGIPSEQFCYQPNDDLYDDAMVLRRGWEELEGYRLATEQEWEFACRAGSRTSHFCGSVNLLDHYAWFQTNSEGFPQPVGMKKPNDLGLFDMVGNIQELCQDLYVDFDGDGSPEPILDGPIQSDAYVVSRGGSYHDRTGALRSTSYQRVPLAKHKNWIGFRIARGRR